MSTKPAQLNPFAIERPASDISIGLRTLAILLRALFVGAVVAITVRVSSPQAEDFVRLAVGFAVCLGIVLHLFTLPRTAEGYRTWAYLGLLVAPLACAAAILIWR